jgi:hypothetical protein
MVHDQLMLGQLLLAFTVVAHFGAKEGTRLPIPLENAMSAPSTAVFRRGAVTLPAGIADGTKNAHACPLSAFGAGSWGPVPPASSIATHPAFRIAHTDSQTMSHYPLFWFPSSGCRTKLYDADAARKVLAAKPVLLLGDSTTVGLYAELKRGVLTDYKGGSGGTSGLAVLRHDVGIKEKAVPKILEALSTHGSKVLIWNWGAHESTDQRFLCPPSKMYSAMLYNRPHLNEAEGMVKVTEFRPGEGWERARNATLVTASASCRRQCKAAARKVFAR